MPQDPSHSPFDADSPDHPVIRLFLYAFGVALSVFVVSGFMFLLQSGVFYRPLAEYNLRDTEKSDQRIAFYTKLSAVVGAAVGIGVCARYEYRIRTSGPFSRK